MVYVTEQPIVPSDVVSRLNISESGSLLFHFAVVKSLANEQATHTTSAIRFKEAGNSEEELRNISDDLSQSYNLDDVLLIRRIGTVPVGEVISLVAVSASRSQDAFEACQYGLQRLKKMTTIKKQEI